MSDPNLPAHLRGFAHDQRRPGYRSDGSTVSTSHSSSRSSRSAPAQPTASGTAGPISGQDAYVAHQMQGIMAAGPNRAQGMLTRARRDADNGSTGLTSGHVGDPATPVGGYKSLTPQQAESFRAHFAAQHDQLPDDLKSHWAGQAQEQNTANGHETPTSTGGASVTPRTSASSASVAGASDFPVATTPRSQVIAGTPQSAARAMLATAAADKQDGDIGRSYGSARIIHEAPSAPDPSKPVGTATDARGNKTTTLAGGGQVTMPATQSQAPLDSAFGAANGNRTGISVDGHEQVKQPDGSFAPGRGEPLALKPAAPTNDPFSTAASAFPVSTTPRPDRLTAGVLDGSASRSGPASSTALSTAFDTATPPTDNLTSSLLGGTKPTPGTSTASPTVNTNGSNQPRAVSPTTASASPSADGGSDFPVSTTPRPSSSTTSSSVSGANSTTPGLGDVRINPNSGNTEATQNAANMGAALQAQAANFDPNLKGFKAMTDMRASAPDKPGNATAGSSGADNEVDEDEEGTGQAFPGTTPKAFGSRQSAAA